VLARVRIGGSKRKSNKRNARSSRNLQKVGRRTMQDRRATCYQRRRRRPPSDRHPARRMCWRKLSRETRGSGGRQRTPGGTRSTSGGRRTSSRRAFHQRLRPRSAQLAGVALVLRARGRVTRSQGSRLNLLQRRLRAQDIQRFTRNSVATSCSIATEVLPEEGKPNGFHQSPHSSHRRSVADAQRLRAGNGNPESSNEHLLVAPARPGAPAQSSCPTRTRCAPRPERCLRPSRASRGAQQQPACVGGVSNRAQTRVRRGQSA